MNITQFPEMPSATDSTTSRKSAPPVCSSALLYFNDSGVACICAWCESRPAAETWARQERLIVTHTICGKCRVRLTEEFLFAHARTA